MKKTIFIKNALILTVSSLILRFVGIIFKVWLAQLIGSEGIGLYQLIFSVYMLAATFATSGISTAVTRLAAEELALGTKRGTLKILRRAIEITLIVAGVTVVTVFFGAEFIAVRFLNDIRAVPALKILPLSLPFMGISSCLRGYFIARRKITPNAVSQLLEQAVRIILIVVLVGKFCTKGLGACAAAVILGDSAAEIFSFLMLWLIWLRDTKKLDNLHRQSAPAVRHSKAHTAHFRSHNLGQIFKHRAAHGREYFSAEKPCKIPVRGRKRPFSIRYDKGYGAAYTFLSLHFAKRRFHALNSRNIRGGGAQPPRACALGNPKYFKADKRYSLYFRRDILCWGQKNRSAYI